MFAWPAETYSDAHVEPAQVTQIMAVAELRGKKRAASSRPSEVFLRASQENCRALRWSGGWNTRVIKEGSGGLVLVRHTPLFHQGQDGPEWVWTLRRLPASSVGESAVAAPDWIL